MHQGHAFRVRAHRLAPRVQASDDQPRGHDPAFADIDQCQAGVARKDGGLGPLVVEEQRAQAVEDRHPLDHLDRLQHMRVAAEDHTGAGRHQAARHRALVLLHPHHVRDTPVDEHRHQGSPRARLAHGGLQAPQVGLLGQGVYAGRPAGFIVGALLALELRAHAHRRHLGRCAHAGGGHEGHTLAHPRLPAQAKRRDPPALQRGRQVAQCHRALIAGVVVGQSDHVHSELDDVVDQLRAGPQRERLAHGAVRGRERHLQVGGHHAGALQAGQQGLRGAAHLSHQHQVAGGGDPHLRKVVFTNSTTSEG